ncbi:MAG: hypothetical protein ACLFSE_01480 [Spirochaetia bacterium]
MIFLLIPSFMFSLSVVIFAEIEAPEEAVTSDEDDEDSGVDPAELVRSRFEEGILDFFFSSPHIAFTAGAEWREIEDENLRDAVKSINADVLVHAQLRLDRYPGEIPFQGNIRKVTYHVIFANDKPAAEHEISGKFIEELEMTGGAKIFSLGRLVGESAGSIIAESR